MEIPRNYRIYVRLWGKYSLRTFWRINQNTTEYSKVFVIHETIAPYYFRRPRGIIVREF